MKAQADLLSLNRSSLYYKPVAPSAEDLALKRRIDEIYTEYPFYGSPRITAVCREGHQVNRKAVQGHMNEMGIAGICPGPNLSKRNIQHQIYPYLLRGLNIAAPDHVWGSDITYIRLTRGWVYLVAIIDWFSRFVVNWELEQTLELDFVLRTADEALQRSQPIMMNSDQGSHFTSPGYIKRLEATVAAVTLDSLPGAVPPSSHLEGLIQFPLAAAPIEHQTQHKQKGDKV